jgi:tRNA-uridine 2-sulfurtransferase
MTIKAVGLFSGGLDSILAVKLMQLQGIAVDVLQFRLGFEPLRIIRLKKQQPQEVTKADIEACLGVTIQQPDVREEFLDVLLHPQHGYGSAMNPCIDCKIFILRKAKDYMHAHGAHFVFTGEVLGQRPMSQHRQTLLQTERRSELQGYLLRPLSAKLLDPTIPEQEGWVNREQLLDIAGRSRAVQMALAAQYHLPYPQPAGGCLLTDSGFAGRVRELMAHTPGEQLTTEDLDLLKVGRHFRLADTLKVIVGRHQADNDFLAAHTGGRWQGEVEEFGSPLVLVLGEPTADQWTQIAQIAVSYTKGKSADHATVVFTRGDEQRRVALVPNLMAIHPAWHVA